MARSTPSALLRSLARSPATVPATTASRPASRTALAFPLPLDPDGDADPDSAYADAERADGRVAARMVAAPAQMAQTPPLTQVQFALAYWRDALIRAHGAGLAVRLLDDAALNAHWRALCPDLPARPLGRPLVAAGRLPRPLARQWAGDGRPMSGYLVAGRGILARASRTDLRPLIQGISAITTAVWTLAGLEVEQRCGAADPLPQLVIHAGGPTPYHMRLCTGCAHGTQGVQDGTTACDHWRCQLLAPHPLLRSSLA